MKLFKKSFATILILLIVLTDAMPMTAFAQEVSPTPMPSSDPTIQVVSGLANPATDSADQTFPTPKFEQFGPPTPKLTFKPPMFAVALAKANFQAKEQIELTVKYSDDKDVSVTIVGQDQDTSPTIDQKKVNGDTVFTIRPQASMKPGKYTISVVDNTSGQTISTQDFTWGVLAINADKSIYLPNETANIAMAVLDEKGDMVCTGIVNLDIESPIGTITHFSTQDNSIIVSPSCRLHQFTLDPDFQTTYQTTAAGRYQMTLTAITDKGSYTTKDRFEVRNSVPFDIQRSTATRIYPPSKYPVHLKIHANEAFTGKIVESVPSNFQISQLEEAGVIAYTDESPILANMQYEKDYGIPQLHLPFTGTYPVTEGFGESVADSHLRAVYKSSGLDGHDGIDFGLPSGTPILSVDDGKIILAKENWIYGTSIVIQHGWGRTYYGHLSKLEVKEGDMIKKGQEIGLSGSTGLATGPHLHFGLKPKDNDINNLYFGKIDPSPYLGIASDDPVLTVADYPAATKALVWNVKIAKGADFTIGYQFVTPPKSPDFYTIGPLQFISSEKLPEAQAKFDVSNNPFVLAAATSSATVDPTLVGPPPLNNETIQQFNNGSIQPDRVVFQEIRPWQLAIDVSTTAIVTRTGAGSCGVICWNVPNSWNNNDNKVEVVGAGGNGGGGSASGGGGGGGGGAYAYTTNISLTPGGTTPISIGAGAGGSADTWFSSTSTVDAGAGGDASNTVKGSGGTVNAGTGFSGGDGGSGGGQFSGGAGGGAGGGGSAGPYGVGAGGSNSDTPSIGVACGGTGGGGNGNGNSGSSASCDGGSAGGPGGNGWNGSVASGGGASGTAGGGVGGNATANSGGGGGGGGGNGSAGGAGNGGNGAATTDIVAGTIGGGGGGGGGGGDNRTAGSGNSAGNGGSPTANSGAGGGGGGNCIDAGCSVGTGASGAAGFIVITWKPQALSLDMIMRHGEWFDNGTSASTFTF